MLTNASERPRELRFKKLLLAYEIRSDCYANRENLHGLHASKGGGTGDVPTLLGKFGVEMEHILREQRDVLCHVQAS